MSLYILEQFSGLSIPATPDQCDPEFGNKGATGESFQGQEDP